MMTQTVQAKHSWFWNHIKFVLVSIILLFLLVPLFPVRIALACLLMIYITNRLISVPRLYSCGLLLVVYSLAFILSPSWNSLPGMELKILCLSLLFIFIVILSIYSSSDIRLDYKFKETKAFMLLGVVLYLMNYIPLKTDIAWRGDEDLHVGYIMDLWGYLNMSFHNLVTSLQSNLTHSIIIFFFPTLAASIVYYILRPFLKKISQNKKIFLVLLLLFAGIFVPLLLVFIASPQILVNEYTASFASQMLRYPSLQKWIGLMFVYPAFYSDIALYRSIPFISVLLLSWFLYIKLKEKIHADFLSLIVSLLFITIPLLFFYSNILYLDMPVVLLTTICIFDISTLLKSPKSILLTRPSWYILLVIPFLKETSLMFLLLILATRTIYQIYHYTQFAKSLPVRSSSRKIKEYSLKSVIAGEVKIWILILAPLAIFLFFRSFFPIYNAHTLKLYKLFYLPNYFIFTKALFDQLGMLFILSISGFLILFLKRRWFLFTVLSVMLIVNIWFFIADSVDYISYVGYSRWNLYLLPILLYTAFFAVIQFKKSMQILVVFLLLFSNIYLLPINIDGSRLPNWGSPSVDTAEYTYPYEEAIKWLSFNGHTKNLLLIGHYYRYDGLRFYFHKYNFQPKVYEHYFRFQRFSQKEEISFFDKFFRDYAENNVESALLKVDTILYHSVNNIPLEASLLYGNKFKIVKKISNSEHSIYIMIGDGVRT